MVKGVRKNLQSNMRVMNRVISWYKSEPEEYEEYIEEIQIPD